MSLDKADEAINCLTDDELSFDEVDFISTDKHKRFLQSDSITMGVCGQACPKCPGFDNYCMLCTYLCLL